MPSITDTDTDTAVITGLRAAAVLIETNGYSAYPDYDGESGYDVHRAISEVADNSEAGGRYFDDRLMTAFYGWLEMTGQIHVIRGSSHADDLVASWELERLRIGDDVVCALRAAADALCPARRKLDAFEITLVRQARDLAALAGTGSMATWLENNGRPAVNPDAAQLLAFGAAQSLIKSLAQIIDDLTA
jgi:hypothetical protein